jgi:hypothetical protein
MNPSAFFCTILFCIFLNISFIEGRVFAGEPQALENTPIFAQSAYNEIRLMKGKRRTFTPNWWRKVLILTLFTKT